jgi:hypothetical protein
VRRDDGWVSLTLDSTLARSLILLATPDHYGEHVRWLESLMAGG